MSPTASMNSVGRRNSSPTRRSLLRPLILLAMNRMTPTTATNSRTATPIVMNFSMLDTRAHHLLVRRLGGLAGACRGSPWLGSTEGATGAVGRVGRGRVRPLQLGWSSRSGLGPGRLDGVHGVLRALAGDPVGGLLPEGVGADGSRHLVGAVEAEDRLRVLQQLGRQLVDRALQLGGVHALVSADPATGRRRGDLVVGPGVGRQVGLEGLDLRAVGEGDVELATTEHRLVVSGLARQEEGEHVAVFGHLGALGEVGRVEAGLTVQRAGALEDRQTAVLEGCRRDALDVAEAAVDVLR